MSNNVAVEQELKLQLKVSEQEKGTLAARTTELAAEVTRLEAELEEAAIMKRGRKAASPREEQQLGDCPLIEIRYVSAPLALRLR